MYVRHTGDTYKMHYKTIVYIYICVDCVCEMEAETKSYPNCFTVGPIIDDGATRTYFISCCKCNLCLVQLQANERKICVWTKVLIATYIFVFLLCYLLIFKLLKMKCLSG